MTGTSWKKGVRLPGLAVILGLVYVFLKPSPKIDEYFTHGFSRWILTGIGSITNRLSFSVAEFFIGLTLLGLLVGSVRFLGALIKREGRLKSLFAVTDHLAFLFIVFLAVWGFNYRALGLEPMLDLTPRQGDARELKELATTLASEAARERRLTGIPESEIFDYTGNLQQAATAAYQSLSLVYPKLDSPAGRVKPLRSSQLFSRLGISGIFIPYTAEANYNDHQPMLLIPSAILHELAHLKGIAREEEASFMAYLASRSSEEPGIRYSATMMALFSTTSQLAKLDRQSAREVRTLYSEGMKLDARDYRDYWDRYSGELQDRADDFNDFYLKSNGQKQGVESYGNMVSFLLAWKNSKPE